MRATDIKEGGEYAVQDGSFTRQLGDSYGVIRATVLSHTSSGRVAIRYAETQQRMAGYAGWEDYDLDANFPTRKVLGTWAEHETAIANREAAKRANAAREQERAALNAAAVQDLRRLLGQDAEGVLPMGVLDDERAASYGKVSAAEFLRVARAAIEQAQR